MEEKHIVDLEIPSYLVDFKKQLRPSCFMSLAQEMAMKAADVLEFGYDQLAEHDLAWVLSRTKLVFEKVPKWQQQVQFATWHKGISGLYFIRDYQLRDKSSGEILVNGTSSWITINTKSRSLFRTTELAQFFNTEAQSSDFALKEEAGKILVPKESELVCTHKVTYSDLDFIGHANNTSYVNWVMDCIPADLLRDSYPKVLEINFSKETKAGEEVQIFRHIEETEDKSVISFDGKVDGRTNFTARFTYEK